MTETERDELMDKLEDLKERLAEAALEAKAAHERVWDLQLQIVRLEARFPECRHWPVAS